MSDKLPAGSPLPEQVRPPTSEDVAAEVRTFLIADVRGYTRFTQEHGDEAAARLASKFAVVTRDAVSQRGGDLLELRGDEALAVFTSARQALRAAAELQERFIIESMEDPSLPLGVGIGLDAGEAIPVEGGYRGGALNLAARLCSLAGAGEVLISDGVAHLVRKIEGLDYAERGLMQLKGFDDPVRVIQVTPSTPAASLTVQNASDVQSHSEEIRDHGQELAAPSLPIGGFLGALPESALVARQDELRRINSWVDAVVTGEGRLVLLAGEPGIGKTRLAQEIMLGVRNRGFIVATGRCYEPHEAVPLFPFREAITVAYGVAPPAIQSQVARRWPNLAHLLPDHSIPLPPVAVSSHDEQQRLFWAVTGFLQAISAEAPVALLLDDLHWADGASLELLQHLARHTRGDRVLLVGMYRDVEVEGEHALDRVLLDLTRERLVERVSLGRLKAEEMSALIATTMGESEVSREFTELVYRRTEGNPFFTEEVLRALVEQGDLYRENGRWTRRSLEEIEVPDTIRAIIRQRITRLSERTQEILRQASVLGQTFAFDDLAAMTPDPANPQFEDELEESLEEARKAGLVRVIGRDQYSFYHALTQHALYTELTPRRRRRLHLMAGHALSQLSESARNRRAAELAWHFLEGEEPEHGLPYAVMAGDQAEAMFSHGDAETHYRMALELAQQLGDEVHEAQARERLGGLLTATIRYGSALAMLEEAAQIYRRVGDWESEGRVVAQIGRVHFVNGTTMEGVARLESLLPSLSERGPSRALAGLYSALSHLFFAAGRYPDALDASQEAAGLARNLVVAGVLAEATVRRGTALAMLDHWREALQVLEESLTLADAASDPFSRCRALQNAGGIHVLMGDLDTGTRYLTQAYELADRMGNPRQVAVCDFGLSITALISGDHNESSLRAERALTTMRSLEGSWTSACQIVGLESLTLPLGEWEAAPRYLKECFAISERGNVRAVSVLAEKDLVDRRPSDSLDRLLSLIQRTSAEPQHRHTLQPLLARAYLETGDMSGAERALKHEIGAAGAADLRLRLLMCLQVEGVLHRWQKAGERARASFDQALSLARDIPYPYMEACILYELGTMNGDRRFLLDAIAIFDRLGVTDDAQRVRESLSDLEA